MLLFFFVLLWFCISFVVLLSLLGFSFIRSCISVAKQVSRYGDIAAGRVVHLSVCEPLTIRKHRLGVSDIIHVNEGTYLVLDQEIQFWVSAAAWGGVVEKSE